MKTRLLLIILLILVLVSPGVFADDAGKQVQCPKTTMQNDCLLCHVRGDFRVKETAPDAHLIYPNDAMCVIDGEGYYLLTVIDSDEIKQYFDYLHSHGIKRAIIEIHSSGGALFDAQRIVNLIRYWQGKGVYVETRIHGAAFSAGFYVFVAGDKRLVSPHADLMWHELQSASFGFNITTPADREEEARVLRHIQDIRNTYLAERSNLTKAQVDEKISKKEFWMSGNQAVEYGFADGFI